MVHDRDPHLIVLEDKYESRKHAQNLGIRVPNLLAVGTDPREVIRPTRLPKSYVVKCNHWSGVGGIAVIKGGKDLVRRGKQWKKHDLRAMFGQRIKERYNVSEWAVDNIRKPLIMVEELLTDVHPSVSKVCDDYSRFQRHWDTL